MLSPEFFQMLQEAVATNPVLRSAVTKPNTPTCKLPLVYDTDNQLYLWIALSDSGDSNGNPRFLVLTRSNEVTYHSEAEGMILGDFATFDSARKFCKQQEMTTLMSFGVRVSRRALIAAEDMDAEKLAKVPPTVPPNDDDWDDDMGYMGVAMLGF